MKQGVITKVSTIEYNKGELVNLVLVYLSNGDVLIRQINQFKTDLTNSKRLLGWDVDSINSVMHPAIQAELPRLEFGGAAMGDWKQVKAGDTYVDNNPESPNYEKTMEYTKDHLRVEGFLTLQPSDKYLTAEINAQEKYTQERIANVASIFGATGATSSNTEDVSEDIPDELVNAIAPKGKEEAVEAQQQ